MGTIDHCEVSDAVLRKLSEVEAVRQARLDAQKWKYQLEQCRNELAHKSGELQQLQARLEGALRQQAAAAPGAVQAAAAALEDAQLEAQGYKCKLGIAELELAKQLDALRELQWQLDSVVAQLGLQQQLGQLGSGGSSVNIDAGAALLSKVSELALAQQQAELYKAQLAAAQAELEQARRACAELQQRQHASAAANAPAAAVPPLHQQPLPADGTPLGGCSFEGLRFVRQAGGRAASGHTTATACAQPEDPTQQQQRRQQQQVPGIGRQLIDALLQENQELRGRLATAEEHSQRLGQELDAELLTKAQRHPCSPGPPPHLQQQQQQQQAWRQHMEGQARPGHPGICGAGTCHHASTDAAGLGQQQQQQHLQHEHQQHRLLGDRNGVQAPARRAQQQHHHRPAVSESMEVLARQRLELRLEEKERTMGKLRGMVKELEAKLVEAYKRQADLAMMESSWREQESLDRRLAEAEGEKASLAAAMEAARADAEAARREAAVQRRLAKRLQQRPVQEGEGATKQAELLQKRVKVLEAQNVRLRLARAQSQDLEPSGGANSRRASENGSSKSREGAGNAGAPEQKHGSADAAVGGGSSSTGLEAGGPAAVVAADELGGPGPVLLKWEADKRLQKKVEVLQGKLKDKSSQLVASHAAREQLSQQLQRTQAELEQAKAAAAAHSQQAMAKAKGASGTGQGADAGHAEPKVPAAKVRELLQQLDDVQRRHDVLERQVAALQHRVPAPASQLSGGAACTTEVFGGTSMGISKSEGGPGGLDGASGSSNSSAECEAAATGGSRPYRPSDYGGAGAGRPAETAESLAAQLMERDVRLFDLALERDQAAAQAARLQQRLESLFTENLQNEAAGPTAPAAALATAKAAAAAPGSKASGGGTASASAGQRTAGSRRRQPSPREQELLDTIALLKSALERTRKGLESGVSNSKYMAAVDKAKQLKAQVSALEAQLGDAAKLKEELGRVQQQLGQVLATNSALKSQVRTARQAAADAAEAREGQASAQVAQLERALHERGAQLAAAQGALEVYGEEVRVLVEEGLHPADLVQELLALRPRLRELQEQNAALAAELASFDATFLAELEALRAEHEGLRGVCARYEASLRELCARYDEPLPPGLAP